MNKSKIQAIFSTWKSQNPSPQTELIYATPYQLLVSVLLSAQMTDSGVNKATKVLFQHASTPEQMLVLGLDKLKEYIKTINYYPTKAKHIMASSEILVKQHGGQVPRSREALETLPGIGRKSANVILNVVFQEPTMAVDTHIFRVCNRTGLAPGKTPLEVEKKLLKVVPQEYLQDAHHWLVLHGRYICQARKPKCETCPIAFYCEWAEKSIFLAVNADG